MKIRKCDKCGKIHQPSDRGAGTIAIKIYDSNHTSWCTPDIYDFCPSCMEKIEKLVKSRGK